jgi:hypothetical protein
MKNERNKSPAPPEGWTEEEKKRREQMAVELREALSKPVSGPFDNMTDDEVMRMVNEEIDRYRAESRAGQERSKDPDRAEVDEGMEDYRAGRITEKFSSPEELKQLLEKEEAEWEALVKSPESQRFLDRMVREAREDKAAGRTFTFDPSDPDWENSLEREWEKENQEKKK